MPLIIEKIETAQEYKYKIVIRMQFDTNLSTQSVNSFSFSQSSVLHSVVEAYCSKFIVLSVEKVCAIS